MSSLGLDDYIEHFRARVLQDALAEATSAYWLRRAQTFEDARPRPGDFTGQATPEELAEADRRCALAAQNCRNAAAVAILPTDQGPEPIVCDSCGTPTSPWSCSCGSTRIGVAA